MLYIDNTYISSLEELKAIIESHIKDKSSKKQDEFRTELIETFEDKTDTGLVAFVEALQAEEAKEYARQLVELDSKWNSLSFSEQYNSLVAFFNISANTIDIMKYVEIFAINIQEDDDKIKVSVDVKVIVPINEYIQFEFKLYDENGYQLHCIATERQSIAVSTNQILHFEKQLNNVELGDKVQVVMNQKVIEEHSVGKILIFSVRGVEFKMIRVKGGKFMMGSDIGNYNEKPIHEVELSDFYIAETQVTQSLWEAIRKRGYTYFSPYGDDYPVNNVSWNQCKDFINKLNAVLGNLNQHDGKIFDFPTEAQWEYAARGGVHHNEYRYSGSDNLFQVGWFNDNRMHQVKLKNANSLGLYDMSGNVWEWCKDHYADDYYSWDEATKKDPICTSSTSCRVARGGCYNDSLDNCTVTKREYWTRDTESYFIGLRLVLINRDDK